MREILPCLNISQPASILNSIISPYRGTNQLVHCSRQIQRLSSIRVSGTTPVLLPCWVVCPLQENIKQLLFFLSRKRDISLRSSVYQAPSNVTNRLSTLL